MLVYLPGDSVTTNTSMASVPAPPAVSGSAQRGNRNRYRRRGPGPASQPRHPNATSALPTIQDSALAFRPASLPPSPAPDDARNGARRGRDHGLTSRRGRGARGRGGSAAFSTMNGRTFGGQLTVDGVQDGSAIANDGLQGDAAVFRPGQHVHNGQQVPNHARSRRMSKSQAPDIATRTHEDIANGLYECPICTSEVLNNSKIWSCKTCWSVFHMSCIKKWAKNEGSTQQRAPEQSGELPPPRQWRCPGCNLPKDDMPTSYTCWCAKELEPKSIPGLPPHSCGQTCGKARAPRRCEHPCDLLCHAGPCPPCSHMGPTQSCFCGKEESTKRCIDTEYAGWSCDQVCGDLMPCGLHECRKLCHEGFCGSCEELVDSTCYCGKERMDLRCCNRDDEKASTAPAKDGFGVESWDGSFACTKSCGRVYDCGKHFCEKECHPQDAEITHCPFSPDIVDHCPCGKTSLKALDCYRTSCDDPIRHCSQQCAHPLSCGHPCLERCHRGECPPCLREVDLKCRCGRTSIIGTCLEAQGEAPECERICRIPRNCGRHECGQMCCSAEKAAIARQSKRKARSAAPRNNIEDFEAEHICTKVCGRQLRCGDSNHTCQEICHSGPCGSCREAIFDEISCNCGRTTLQPPLPCGTKPPVCQYQCNRQKSCGHPQVPHQCHQDDSQCPKCPYLVQKACMCGKSQLKNQPCWSTQVNCGQTCNKKLKCGTHRCRKTCHKPGECEDASSVACPHICGQPKTVAGCGHPDLDPCHAPYPCKEDKPCQAKLFITCECQHQKKELKCMASKTEEGNGSKVLPCDDECLRLQRNQKLAAALNISSDHLDDHIPYSTTTLDMFQEHIKWSQTQEREFRVFAADEDEKRLRFKPMVATQRAFLHALAEDFGMDSESSDPEPHRHVTVFKSPRFVSAPMKTLSQCLKIRAAPIEVAATKVATPMEPYNALLLTAPRFALTIDELRSDVQSDLLAVGNPSLNISFLPSEEIVLTPAAVLPTTEATLTRLKPLLHKTIQAKNLASAVYLCTVDTSLNVTRKEEDRSSAGGWSQVVKGVAAKTRVVDRSVGQRSQFTVLGKVVGAKNKKTVAESTVDDWERDVDGWE